MTKDKYDVIVNYLKTINTKLNILIERDNKGYEPKHKKSDKDEVMEMLNDMFEDLGNITIIRSHIK